MIKISVTMLLLFAACAVQPDVTDQQRTVDTNFCQPTDPTCMPLPQLLASSASIARATLASDNPGAVVTTTPNECWRVSPAQVSCAARVHWDVTPDQSYDCTRYYGTDSGENYDYTVCDVGPDLAPAPI